MRKQIAILNQFTVFLRRRPGSLPAGMLMALALFVSYIPGHAQPLYENVATATTSGDGTLSGLTISVPASTSGGSVGDLLVLVHGVNINPTTQTPSGWTAVTGHAGANEAICSSQIPEGIRCQLSVFWKFSDGTETNVFINLTNPGSPRQVAGAVLRYSNTHTASPIGPVMSQPGTGTTLTAPATTTTEANSLVLRLGLADANGPDNAADALSGGPATERFNLQTRTPVNFNAVFLAGSDAVQAAAGGTGTATWTGGDGNWRASTITIRPMQTIVSADLSVSKDDGQTKVNAGASITYTIVASNSAGSTDDVTGAKVSDMFPAALSCTWTCGASGAATCTAAGSGDIDDTVDLPVGDSVTYSATCLIDSGATGTIMNTATIDGPDDLILQDGDESNNFDSDTTQINQPPVAVCADAVVNADASCQASASIDGGSNDPDGDLPLIITQDPPGPYSLGDTGVTLNVEDQLGLTDSCQAMVTVVDASDPVIACNNPATITPPDPLLSFTATAEDNCGVASVSISSFSCHRVNGAGKVIDLTKSCMVSAAGATINIPKSNGVGTIIAWTVNAEDGSGNTTSTDCSIEVVIPGQN